MQKHPTPPIDGFQWDQDFVLLVDAFLEVSKKQNISGNSHFSPFEQYLAEACFLYKMFTLSEDNIRSHITAVIQNPDQSDVSRKLIYCFLAIHIDLNKNVADIVKKYIIPFLFLSDRGCDNEFIESAFEYFILCRVFGKKDAKPKGELVKVVGPKSIQFTLESEDQRNQIKKAFKDFDLLSSFEQIII